MIVSSPDRRRLRREPDESLVTHADLGQPGWNDIVADGRGNAYVNRPGFNPMAGEAFQPGFVYLARADGLVHQVADGMALTADHSTLIVADSYRHHLIAFNTGADGGLSGRRVSADLGEAPRTASAPTPENAVWYADVSGRRVPLRRSPRAGRLMEAMGNSGSRLLPVTVTYLLVAR